MSQSVFDSQDNKGSEVPLPHDIIIETQDDELKIIRRPGNAFEGWGSRILTLLFVFSCFFFCIASMGYSFYVTILQSSWLWGVAGLGLIFLTWLAYEALFVGFFDNTLIWVDQKTIRVRETPWPSLLHRETLNRNDVKQLYVEKYDGFGDEFYDLIAITVNNQKTKLIRSLNSSTTSLYLEYILEQFLELENEPVTGEFGPLFETQVKRFATWKLLAQRHHLTFVNRGLELCLSGYYRDSTIEFKASPKDGFQEELHLCLQVSAANKVLEDDVVQALVLADVINLFTIPENVRLIGQVSFDSATQIVYYEADILRPDLETQQFVLDRCCELLQAHNRIVKLGGLVISTLQGVLKQNETPFEPIAKQLLRDIAMDTTNRLADPPQRLICSTCFSTPTSYDANVGGRESVTYYACRICQQSQTFFSVAKTVVAVLDQGMTVEYEQKGVQYLRVNWLHQRTLFDFDAVEIVQATDEEVERFAVQVGNDTDLIRNPRYREMPCVISTKHGLSENTMRILQRTFGHVEVKEMANF